MVQGPFEFPRKANEHSSSEVPPRAFRGPFKQLHQVKSLVLPCMVVVELGREQKAEILVAPRSIAYVGRPAVHLIL